MDNLLFSIQSSGSLQLIESQQSCWVLRANVDNPNVVHHFSQEEILLPHITQIATIQQQGIKVRALGISIDESWWLIPPLDSNNATTLIFTNKLHKLVQDYNQYNEDRESTIAWIEQSDAYKMYHLSGINHHATELLTHLIAYDWFGLQRQLEQTQSTSESASSQEKVVATVMQTVPIVVCVQPNHHYTLIIRHSFADYALDVLKYTTKLLG